MSTSPEGAQPPGLEERVTALVEHAHRRLGEIATHAQFIRTLDQGEALASNADRAQAIVEDYANAREVSVLETVISFLEGPLDQPDAS